MCDRSRMDSCPPHAHSTKPITPLPPMRPGLAHAALSRELARRLGLDGRPFAWPAGAMEHGWELAAELATLRRLQSQLERSTRQQDERLLLHGCEGGGSEGGGGEGSDTVMASFCPAPQWPVTVQIQ